MNVSRLFLLSLLVTACSTEDEHADSGNAPTDSGNVDTDTADTGDIPVLNTYYLDNDGDGYGTDEAVEAQSAPEGYAPETGDCDDTNALIHPGMTEACDGIDNDCDGTPDQDIDSNWPNTPDLWETIDYPSSDFPFVEVVMLEYSSAHDSLWAILMESNDVDYHYALYEYKDGEWSFDQIVATGPDYPFEFHIDPNGQMYLLGWMYDDSYVASSFFHMRDFNEGFWTSFELEYQGAEARSVYPAHLISRQNAEGEHEVVITGRTVSIDTGIQSAGVWELTAAGLTQTDDHVITDAADRDHTPVGLALAPDGTAAYVGAYEDVDDLYVTYLRAEQSDGSYATLSEVHLTGETETYETFVGLTVDSNGRFYTGYKRWDLARTKPSVFGIYTGVLSDSSTHELMDLIDASETDESVFARNSIVTHPRGTVFAEVYTQTDEDGDWSTDPSRSRQIFAGDETGIDLIVEDRTYQGSSEAMLVDASGKLWRSSTAGLHVLSCWSGQ